jgi:tRNA A37 threonylcarbamoyladenosine dehydratase
MRIPWKAWSGWPLTATAFYGDEQGNMEKDSTLIDVEQDSQRRFGGVERLYGNQVLARFARTKVAVVGVGGVGSWVAEALVRTGFECIRLVDLDHIAPSNTNRQLHALNGNFGKSKVLAMRERMLAINPGASIDVIDDFLDPTNVDRILDACDAVIDCVDQVRAKAAMAAWARHHHRHIVVCGGAGGRTDPARIRSDDLARTRGDALLASVRNCLRREYGFPAGQTRESPRFGVIAVFSDEDMVRTPACDTDPAPGSPLACGGFGSAVTVTATMGFLAAARLMDELQKIDGGQPGVVSGA